MSGGMEKEEVCGTSFQWMYADMKHAFSFPKLVNPSFHDCLRELVSAFFSSMKLVTDIIDTNSNYLLTEEVTTKS